MNRELLKMVLDALEDSEDDVRQQVEAHRQLMSVYRPHRQKALDAQMAKHEEAIRAVREELNKETTE